MKKYSRLRRDLVFGICTLCFAIFFGISSIYTINTDGESGVTGRTFPFIITSILLILSCILIYVTTKRIRQIPEDDRIYEECVTNYEMTRIIQFIIALIVYVLGFIYIGFIVSTTLFLAYMMYYMHAPNKKIAGAIVIIAPLLLWYFFTRLMEVSFPEALLF